MTEVLKKMNTFELVILERQPHLLIGGSLYATAGPLGAFLGNRVFQKTVDRLYASARIVSDDSAYNLPG